MACLSVECRPAPRIRRVDLRQASGRYRHLLFEPAPAIADNAFRLHHVFGQPRIGCAAFSSRHPFDRLAHCQRHRIRRVTDHDLDREGAALLRPYRAVVTGSHPEYHTPNTLGALQDYVDGGGRLAYLGGNGFYWRIATSPEIPDVLEIRRAEGGIRNWAAEPGEYFHALDAGYGGLWRRNGRPPQMLRGVGFSAQGLFEGSYYRRMPGADDPRAAWIFDGIEDEIIGDFGLSGGGAAGFELDRADFA